ncbi:MAG: hypothetical protein ABMA64_12450 [Myxococcota bacterium]
MRRWWIAGAGVVNVAMLVATSPPRVEVGESVPFALELNPEQRDVWIELEYEYSPDPKLSAPYSGVSLVLAGDNLGSTGQLQLFQLPEPRLDAGVPDEMLGDAAVDAGLGAPLAVDVYLSGPVTLRAGRHTTWLLVHLDGEADVVLDGELTLSAQYSANRTSAELHLVEVR